MRTAEIALGAVLAGFLAAASAVAQEQPTHQEMMAAWEEAMKLGPQHEALATRSGIWATTTTYAVEPGSDEMMTEQGTVERTVTLDGRVLEEDFQGTMMGQPYAGVSRSGYDNVTDEYWSTWNDNMSTGLMVVYGTYDEATSTYIYEGVSHDPLMGEVPTRIEQKIEGPDRETMTLSMQMPGQEMMQMMQIVYERQQ
jgi:hypothetical protein